MTSVWIVFVILGIVILAAGLVFFIPLTGSLLFLAGTGILLVAIGATGFGGVEIIEFVGPIGVIVLLVGLYLAYSAGSFPF